MISRTIFWVLAIAEAPAKVRPLIVPPSLLSQPTLRVGVSAGCSSVAAASVIVLRQGRRGRGL
jgi:hypothetical protein